ncbi:MAG: tetratricopeptide repeat protein [Labilibaculum sp.]|nr:tetratricopeptide repeat protein [Labilibaculum sp.]MBI9060136.1 tetratricopeptide repeat protein [Labilibaculum sp.]
MNDYSGFLEFALKYFESDDGFYYYFVDSVYGIFIKLNGVEKAGIKLKDYILKSNLSRERKYHLMINCPKIPFESDEALTFYMEALESNPQNTDAMINIAKIYYNLEDYKIALDWYLKALDIVPNNIGLILDIATVHTRLNDKKNKLKFLLKALEIDPENDRAKLLITLYHQKNREKTEVEIEKQILYSTKEGSWSQYYRGMELASEGDYNGAIVELTKSIEQCDDEYSFYPGLKARGLIKIKKGDKEEGMRDLYLAQKYNPYLHIELLDTGIELYHKEYYDKSLKAFSVAIELDPMFDEAYFFRAKTYLKIGKKEEARLDLLKAFELGRIGALDVINEECDK